VRSAYRHSTRILASLTFGLGVALIVATIARGGGPLAVGVLAGIGLMMFGAARLYLAGQR
jgi:hypothetical protein